MFRKQVMQMRTAAVPLHVVENNNTYATKWMGPLFIGLYISISSQSVLSGDTHLGYFLSVIGILDTMSNLFQSFFDEYQRIEEVFDPLVSLTLYFNLSTELPTVQEANKNEWLWMKVQRDALLRSHNAAKSPHQDMIPIVLQNFGFSYDKYWHLRNASRAVAQGNLIAITGAHGSGRCTLLKMLAKVIFPQEGHVFCPSHLRTLFVSLEPVILTDITLWDNLTLGCPLDIDPFVVEDILTKMGMTRVLHALRYFGGHGTLPHGTSSLEHGTPGKLWAHGREHTDGHKHHDHIGETPREEMNPLLRGPHLFRRGTSWQALLAEDDFPDREHSKLVESRQKDLGVWFQKLNYTDKVKIHLARAFIMNPEIMLLHRPLLHFSDETSRLVLTLILEHLNSRGLCLPTEGPRRRPRTVFYSTDFDWQASAADVVWHLDSQTKTLDEKRPPASQLPWHSEAPTSQDAVVGRSLGADNGGFNNDDVEWL